MEDQAKMKEHGEEGYYKAADGKEIYSRTWKEKGGTLNAILFFVHGLGSHISRWETIFPQFNEAGIRVHAMDLRGHGKTVVRNPKDSKGNLEGLNTFLSDFKDLWDREWNMTAKRFIMGHSMGGLLAMLFALSNLNQVKIDGVLLSAPAFKPGTPINPIKHGVCNLMVKAFPDITVDNGLNVNNLSRDPKIVEEYKKDPLVHRKVSLGTALLILNQGKYLLAHGAEKVNFPLYLAHGTADELTDYTSSKAFMEAVSDPRKQFVSYEGYYHELHNEPKEFSSVVLEGYIKWIKETAANNSN